MADKKPNIFSLWDAENGISFAHKDGGPGSGNHNHQGRPGEVGGSAPGNGSREVVHGKDISKTYTGDKSTKAVIEHQGFGGLPKIVKKKEFDAAVKASKFVAQRTYSASSQEILDAYRDQLHNGDFYVDCTIGGAQYGQGMYTVADYNGEITEGMQQEIEHYRNLGTTREKTPSAEEISSVQKAKDSAAQSAYDAVISKRMEELSEPERCAFLRLEGTDDEEIRAKAREFRKSDPEAYDAFIDKYHEIVKEAQTSKDSISRISLRDYAMQHGMTYGAVSYVETITLDPSAKIVTYHDIVEQYKAEYGVDGVPNPIDMRLSAKMVYNMQHGSGSFSKLSESEQAKYVEEQLRLAEIPYDIGAYAAMKGYDAINAEGHGLSGSYTVILNRTKAIFLDPDDRTDRADADMITFQPYDDGLIYAIRNGKVIGYVKVSAPQNERKDGGPGSGNFGHEGREGEVGGSAPSGKPTAEERAASVKSNNEKISKIFSNPDTDERYEATKKMLRELPKGSSFKLGSLDLTKVKDTDDRQEPCFARGASEDPDFSQAQVCHVMGSFTDDEPRPEFFDREAKMNEARSELNKLESEGKLNGSKEVRDYEAKAEEDGKITSSSDRYGEPGTYVVYRAGEIRGGNRMSFFAPTKEDADSYATAGDDERAVHRHEIQIQSPLVVKGSTDVEMIKNAWEALHPYKFAPQNMTPTAWKRMDKENAAALLQSGSKYDAIIYLNASGSPHEVQIPAKQYKSRASQTGTFTTTQWSRHGRNALSAVYNGEFESDYERIDHADGADTHNSAAVLVIKDGKILIGIRLGKTGNGQICGPGGHVQDDETVATAAIRETEEEFGIVLNELVFLDRGPIDEYTGNRPYIFMSTDYDGDPKCDEQEMSGAKFLSIEEIIHGDYDLFDPFRESIFILLRHLAEDREDGGPGSGNFGHAGRPGEVGGSANGIVSATHISSSSANAESILKGGFDLSRSGTKMGSIWGEGAYFSTGELENKVWESRKGSTSGVVADIDTSGMLRVNFNGLVKNQNDLIRKASSFFTNEQKKEFKSMCRKLKDSGESVSPESDAFKKIAQKYYTGIIVEQDNTNGFWDYQTGGNQIVVYDKSAIKSLKNREDGGPGSGNFGHEGRPGEIGGSMPGDGIRSEDTSRASKKGLAVQKLTKRRANDYLREHASNKDRDGIRAILGDLPNGSVVKLPDSWNDDGKGDKYVKRDDGSWYCKRWKMAMKDDELIGYFESASDPADMPEVISVAMTEDAKARDLSAAEKAYWRNNDRIWGGDNSFGERMTVKLQKKDLDNCGDGFHLIGTDGKDYIKFEGEWFDSATFSRADMRKLKSPEFSGDFFEINFGMNGVSADECALMRKRYDEMPESLRKKYEEVFRTQDFEVSYKGISYFSPDGTIRFTRNADAESITHECAHKFDRGAIDKTVDSAYGFKYRIQSASQNMDWLTSDDDRKTDFQATCKAIGIPTDGSGWFVDGYSVDTDGFDAYYNFYKAHRDIDGFGIVSDAISAITQNQIDTTFFGGGHEKEYWQRPYGGQYSSARSKEFWANFCSAKAGGYDEALDLLKTVTPRLYAACEETYKEVFGDD